MNNAISTTPEAVEEKNKKKFANKTKKEERSEKNRGKILKILESEKKSGKISNISEEAAQKLSKFSRNDLDFSIQSAQLSGIEKKDLLDLVFDAEKNALHSFFSLKKDEIFKPKNKKSAEFVFSIPLERIFSEYNAADQKKYLKVIPSLSENSAMAKVWGENVAQYPEFFSANIVNMAQKQKLLGIVEKLNISLRGDILDALQNILNPDVFAAAFQKAHESSEEDAEVTKKEENMKALVAKKLGTRVVNSIESKQSESMNANERLRITLEVAREELMKEQNKAEKHLAFDEYYSHVEKSEAFLIDLLEETGYSKKEKKEYVHELQRRISWPKDYVKAIRNNDKKAILELMHLYEGLSLEDLNETLEQQSLLAQKRQEVIIDFTKSTNAYGEAIKLIKEYFPDVEYVGIEKREKISELHECLQNKGFSISLHALEMALSLQRMPTPLEFGFVKSLQGKYSTQNHKFPDDLVQSYIYSGPSELLHSIPKSMLHSLLKRPTRALLHIEDPNFERKKLRKINAKVNTLQSMVFDDLQSGKMGMSHADNAAIEYKEKGERTTLSLNHLAEDVFPFIAEKLQEIPEQKAPHVKAALDEVQEIQSILHSGIAGEADSRQKFSHNLTLLGEKVGGLEDIAKGLPESDVIELFEDLAKQYARRLFNVPAEIRGQELRKMQVGSPLESVPQTANQIVEGRVEKFLDQQSGIALLLNKIFSSSESFTAHEAHELLALENVKGLPFFRNIASLSEKQKKQVQWGESYGGSFFEPNEEAIYLAPNLFRRFENLAKTGIDELSPQEKVELRHEGTHLLLQYSSLEENFKRLVQQKTGNENFLAQLNSPGGVLWNNQRLSLALHHPGENAADFTQELICILGGGKPYDPKMNGVLSALSGILGAENVRKIFDDAKNEFSEKFGKKYSFENVGYNPTSFAQNNDGMGSVENVPSGNSGSEKEVAAVLDRNGREIFLRDLRVRFEDMNKVLSDFRGFRSHLPSEQKNRLEGWDKYFQDKMAQDENSIAHDPVMTTDTANDIIESYGVKDTKGPRSQLNNMMAKLSEATIEDRGFLGEMWANTTFLSLADIGKIWETTWEFTKRRHDRNSRRRTGTAGSSMFAGVIDSLGNEFQKDFETAEKEEVQSIKDGLSNMSTELIYESFLTRVQKADDLDAALQELADRGMIDWNHPIIWKTLHKLGSGVTFYESDFRNSHVRDTKYSIAFNRLYDDSDMFQQIHATNESNISSGVNKWAKESGSKLNALVPNLNQWILNKKKGVFVDPLQYEGYVDSLKQYGKGDPMSPIYYLVIGVAEGILTPDAPTRFLTKYINDYPASELFSHDPTLEEFKNWEREILYNSSANEYLAPEDGVPSNFRFWVDRVIYRNDFIKQRTIANIGDPAKMDHDHARVLGSIGNAEGAFGLIAAGSTGAQRFKPTMYNNIAVGILEHAVNFSLQENEIPFEELRDDFIRQAGYFAAFDGGLNGRINTGRSLQRFSNASLKSKPREGGNYNGDLTTEDYLNANRTMFASVKTPELKVFLEKFVFNNDEYNGNVEKLHKDFQNWMKNDPDGHGQKIQKALATQGKANLTYKPGSSDGQNFYQQAVPALFEYYLTPNSDNGVSVKEANENLQGMLSAAKNISNGTQAVSVRGVEKIMANTKDVNNTTLSQKERNGVIPPATTPIHDQVKNKEMLD